MGFHPIDVIKVNYYNGQTKVPMGRLARKDRRIFFEYFSDFIDGGLQLSPFYLPLKAGLQVCNEQVFEGLFGVFNDSLPDGWGRLLLDRKLMSMGINPGALTPLDRLRYVGGRGMGALMYEPEIPPAASLLQDIENLDPIANECVRIQEQESTTFVDDLLAMNGSSAGARPKILVSLAQDEYKLRLSNNIPSSPHNDWIIKFRSSTDPKDIGCIEYAYHLMAIDAGLQVPMARLFPSQKCMGYFGVKRFDRTDSEFLHMHSVSGLLHADHRIPSLDYEMIMKATLWLTKDVRECENQFRNAIFNVFAHNRDDHAKNFSFLMNSNGVWTVSPAYDLTFSTGPSGEHCTTIMGQGKSPKMEHFLKLAEIASIKPRRATQIIDQVKSAVSKWNDFAQKAQVGSQSERLIQNALNEISKNAT